MKIVLVVLTQLTFLTSSASAQDTVQVKTGWNIIGSVKAGAVPDALYTIPDSLISSSFWGYAPGVGYQSWDTLDNGIGYWVKVKSDGVIIFNNAPPVDSCKSKGFIYQGKFYHTVKIGEQCWMAENLDAGMMVSGVTNQADNDTVEKYCYNDSLQNCALYGGLYTRNETVQYSTSPGAQGICPTGWHIPTNAEFQKLSSAVGGDGNALKVLGQGIGGAQGTNTSGFSSLFSGYRRYNDGGFTSLHYNAFFWSSAEFDTTGVRGLGLSSGGVIIVHYYGHEDYGVSARCIED